jgi:predicted helicase
MSHVQAEMFAPENTERIAAQEAAPIFVIIGNPPYNVGQVNENDNNKNRRHPEVDRRISATYARSSRATNKKALSDMYVKFFRWATDRLGDRDGVICFVSNNSFLDQFAFDGMRKELLRDFTAIYALDLGGNVRQNPKLSGTTHNVFGIQVGVAITLLIRNRGGQSQTDPASVYYTRVDEWWRKEQKYAFLESSGDMTHVEWQRLTPDSRGTWLTHGASDEFHSFLPMGSRESRAGRVGAGETIFRTYSLGLRTNRDDWAYNFSDSGLAANIKRFADTYNSDVDRWMRRSDKATSVDDFVTYDDKKIKWSRDLKLDLQRGRYVDYSQHKIRRSMYRPFCKQFVFFDRILNEEVYGFPGIFPDENSEKENLLICVSGIGHDIFYCQVASSIVEMKYSNAANGGTQTFPFYTYDEDGSNRRENITDWALSQFQAQYGARITKWDIFHYIYGLLHAPDYRRKYAQNLKRDLPHIPLVTHESFGRFVAAGRRLAELHIGYESVEPYPLKHIENRDVPWTWRVERMRLSADRTQVRVNDALTLAGIPPEVYEYRLGNRSALEWVIDQYQRRTDRRSGITSDPNNPDDPEYIVRLLKQVITVSLATVRIVADLPAVEAVVSGDGRASPGHV